MTAGNSIIDKILAIHNGGKVNLWKVFLNWQLLYGILPFFMCWSEESGSSWLSRKMHTLSKATLHLPIYCFSIVSSEAMEISL